MSLGEFEELRSPIDKKVMSWLKNFENESISFWEGSGNGKGSGAYIMVNATKGLFISWRVAACFRWHSFTIRIVFRRSPVNRYCLETQLLTFAYANPLVKSEELGKAIRVEILLKSKIEKCEKHSDLDKVGLQAKDCSELGDCLAGSRNWLKQRIMQLTDRINKSPGNYKCNDSTFEALTQFGTATITTRNIGTLEASYNITMKFLFLDQRFDRSKAYILKDSNFNKIDRATCQFVTTAILFLLMAPRVRGRFRTASIRYFLKESFRHSYFNFSGCSDTGTRKDGMNGFFDAIRGIWKTIWGYFVDFFTVIILLWLLHKKGLFDPFYDGGRIDLVRGDVSRVDEKDRKEIQSHQTPPPPPSPSS
ncbi:hypothetical protein H6P81_016348 [Aristolochia fimbriata]|uniref:Uncharacterized protein n=1 Tax=Aristolochia fimbriata TaxID=158543 RepID=A0AAV7ECN6_ARIFI|nr:hypothetical protein H6P81_016348 [Aristolochia fimbriata]